MARNMASELAPRGVRVNVVVPGGTRTPIWANRAPTPEARSAMEEHLSLSIPVNRFAYADEVARVALFLASEDASYVTGAEIVVDGGMSGSPSGAPISRQVISAAFANADHQHPTRRST